jgi:hypothetical protein
MNFANMTTMVAGVWANLYDYNMTVLCMTNGLDRENRRNCRNIPKMWPAAAGALLFSQVYRKIFVRKENTFFY